MLAFDRRIYYNLGTLAPGETKQVELTQDRNIAGHLKDLVPEYFADLRPLPVGADRPLSDLMQAILLPRQRHLGHGPRCRAGPLHDLDLTGQLQLGRPMLVAEIERPMTELGLGTLEVPPDRSDDHLRVILPLKAIHVATRGSLLARPSESIDPSLPDCSSSQPDE